MFHIAMPAGKTCVHVNGWNASKRFKTFSLFTVCLLTQKVAYKNDNFVDEIMLERTSLETSDFPPSSFGQVFGRAIRCSLYTTGYHASGDNMIGWRSTPGSRL